VGGRFLHYLKSRLHGRIRDHTEVTGIEDIILTNQAAIGISGVIRSERSLNAGDFHRIIGLYEHVLADSEAGQRVNCVW